VITSAQAPVMILTDQEQLAPEVLQVAEPTEAALEALINMDREQIPAPEELVAVTTTDPATQDQVQEAMGPATRDQAQEAMDPATLAMIATAPATLVEARSKIALLAS